MRPHEAERSPRREGSAQDAADVKDSVTEALNIARSLAAAGIPVFVAYPDPGKPGDYKPRGSWQTFAANPAYVNAWKPGLALCAVMGQGLDLIDIDPRNGGDIEALNGITPTVLGAAASPSGGHHLFVRSMGVRSRDGVLRGIDVKAGDPDGQGRGFAFIAPTVRVSKTTGERVAYRWVTPPDLAQLGADERSGDKLAALIGKLRGGGTIEGSGNGTGWTDPDIDALIEHGIPGDVSHDNRLRDVVWKLRAQFQSRPVIYCVWQTIVGRTALKDPSRPWTNADFERHWQGADRKQGNLIFHPPEGQATGEPAPPAAEGGRRLVLTPASEITPEPVVWAWEQFGQGRIPAGSVGLFAGREGTGKSSFLIWAAAQVTRGELPGAFKGDPRPVIYVTFEDSWKFTIVPRLMAAGADLDLIYRAEVQAIDGDTYSLSLPADNKLLEEAITTNRVALVVIDPLLSAISDVLDTHVNRKVRQALDPLASLADRTGAVIAGIAHFSKSSGTDASSLITGSGAFKDVARFIFAFATEEDDGNTGVVTQTKNSLGHSNLPSLAYRIIEAVVPTPHGDARVGQFVLAGEADRTVRDLLGTKDGGEEQGEKTRAEDYLRQALTNGPRRTKEVEEEAREVHDISPRTFKRARSSLRIPTAKHGDSWWISLPEHEGDLKDLPAKSAKGAKDATRGPVGTVGTLPRSSRDLHCAPCGAPISPLRLAQAGQLCVRCEATS